MPSTVARPSRINSNPPSALETALRISRKHSEFFGLFRLHLRQRFIRESLDGVRNRAVDAAVEGLEVMRRGRHAVA